MEIKLSLALPRDEISIPVVRRICAQSLKVLGVTQECINDVELALTEACANVLLHAQDGDEYEVSVGVDNEVAVIEVSDYGGGFDAEVDPDAPIGAAGDSTPTESVPEQGRGIFLMRALMDQVQFNRVDGPYRGTRVHLEKTLVWEDSAPGARLARPRSGLGPWGAVPAAAGTDSASVPPP
ncbi:ATP-binding protein [Frankia sp. AgKG'84/4]|uniref:ATP-binding protein n=1 Tax=Frankia sp. AgKG'84/4 TaxID=573490 RepID=UPI00200BBD11|nr:ATP-binding protein [Frankia sp. AgKG'84/4]MCL9795500.1 ATP-binding protein [Frankia sp. AgKG'84/4]